MHTKCHNLLISGQKVLGKEIVIIISIRTNKLYLIFTRITRYTLYHFISNKVTVYRVLEYGEGAQPAEKRRPDPSVCKEV